MIIDKITSLDGTDIEYYKFGTGPSLIIIHGSFRAAENYTKLAECLAQKFTVYIINRRGRGKSGDQGINYSIQKEVADITTVLRKTESSFLFGHSFGGLVALETAMVYQIKKLALYEPAISVNKSLDIDWIPHFEEKLNQQEFSEALIIFFKSMGVNIPDEQLKVYVQNLSETPEWQETTRILHTIVNEAKEAYRLDSTIKKYKSISGEILFMKGTVGNEVDILFNEKSSQALKTVIENLKIKTFDGFDHNAPDMTAPDEVASALFDFFL